MDIPLEADCKKLCGILHVDRKKSGNRRAKEISIDHLLEVRLRNKEEKCILVTLQAYCKFVQIWCRVRPISFLVKKGVCCNKLRFEEVGFAYS